MQLVHIVRRLGSHADLATRCDERDLTRFRNAVEKCFQPGAEWIDHRAHLRARIHQEHDSQWFRTEDQLRVRRRGGEPSNQKTHGSWSVPHGPSGSPEFISALGFRLWALGVTSRTRPAIRSDEFGVGADGSKA